MLTSEYTCKGVALSSMYLSKLMSNAFNISYTMSIII